MATNLLQHAKIDPEFSLGYNLHTAMTRHGKSPWSQVREIWRLRYGPSRLRPDEYYYYGLYDDRRFAFADKVRFLGRTLQDRIIRQCNAAEWWFVAHDKLVCYGLLAGRNLNAPVNGVRPDPAFSNIVLASPDGEGNAHNVHA